MVEALIHRVADGVAKRSLGEDDVRVGEEQPLSAGAVGASPERVILAEPSGGQVVHAERLYPRVLRRELADDVAGGVARTVVDDDDLEVGVVLRQKRADRASDRGRFVARRHDDREPRQRHGLPRGTQRWYRAPVSDE